MGKVVGFRGDGKKEAKLFKVYNAGVSTGGCARVCMCVGQRTLNRLFLMLYLAFYIKKFAIMRSRLCTVEAEREKERESP